MGDKTALAQAAARLANAERVLITTHVNPDGDGIGSGLGLALGLEALGKEAVVQLDEPVPGYLQFLPGQECVRLGNNNPEWWDALVTLDCGTWQRLGGTPSDRSLFGTVINLDHHPSNDRFGDLDAVDPEASATGLLVYRLLKEIGTPIGADTALGLYTAIATDTGFFRYSNTDGATFEAATELVRAGASPYIVHHAIHENCSPSRLRMMREALGVLEYCGDGRIGLIALDLAAIHRAEASVEDTEGLVELPRSVATVEVAVLLRPIGEGTSYKASLRSKQKADVSRIASSLSGGGHARAAGCTLEGPLNQARDRLVAAIQEELNRMG